MVIEFAGLPGVGKTATARAVAEQLCARYRRVHTATPRDVVRHPLLSISRTIALSRTIGHKGHTTGAIRLARQHLAQLMLAAECPEPMLVLCDGIVHKLAGYWIRDEGAFEHRSFVNVLDAPGTVYYLYAEPADVRSRIASKQTLGPVNRKLAAEDVTGEYWTRVIEVYGEALRNAARYRPVERVDASQPLDDVVETIVRNLQ